MGSARRSERARGSRIDPFVSIVLPAYYSDRVLPDCLAAIERQTYPRFEVIVVNSSPEGRTSQVVAERFPRVVFHQHATRLLPHAARNVGVSMAKGDLIVFTDPDCRPAPDWLAVLVEASVAGWPVVQGSADLEGGSWIERGIHLCKRHSLLPGLPTGSPWIVSSINVAYARSAWQAAGPLDGDLFCADALLGWRAATHGYRAHFEPRAVVVDSHDGGMIGLIRERFTRGREFASARAQFEGCSRWRAAAFALGFPALLALVLSRATRDAWAAGWFGDFVRTLPVQVAGQLAWILGESRVYAERAIRGAGTPSAEDRRPTPRE